MINDHDEPHHAGEIGVTPNIAPRKTWQFQVVAKTPRNDPFGWPYRVFLKNIDAENEIRARRILETELGDDIESLRLIETDEI